MATERAVRVDSLPAFIDPRHSHRFEALYHGLRHPSDKPTLRTILVDLSLMLGVPQPEWELVPPTQFNHAHELITALTVNTHFAPLLPEFLCGLGFDPKSVIREIQPQPLDFLILSGRFGQDPLFDALADHLAEQGRKVASLNVVGTYNDQQRRFMGLPLLTRPVDHAVVLAQTQAQRGGSFKTLRHALRTLKNIAVAQKISRVDTIVPFYAGGRGHRLSQRPSMGFEVFEASTAARELSNTIHEVTNSLRGSSRHGLTRIPQFTVYTIDIHNPEEPGRTFRRHRIDFVSLNPAPEFADAIYQEIQLRDLLHLPLRIVACDQGAIPRTETTAQYLLRHPQNRLRYVDVVYIHKTRIDAGIVDPTKTKVARVIRFAINPSDSIHPTQLPPPTPDHPDTQPCILIPTDDMADTGGTAAADMQIINQHYPRAKFKMFVATHPVLSQGPQKLNRIEADIVILGNTLPTEDLTHQNGVEPDVRIANLAPTLARALTA